MILEQIGGVSIEKIASTFSTPTYVYDRAVIEKRVKDLSAFPTIRYAQKANSNIAILSLVRQLNVEVDATSAGEIHRAIKAGYQPEQIVYTSDIFDRETLKTIATLPVGINAGSMDMISQIASVSPGRKLTLRINPGFGHGHSQKTNTGGEGSKHGIWHDLLPACLDLARSSGVTINGIHMHMDQEPTSNISPRYVLPWKWLPRRWGKISRSSVPAVDCRRRIVPRISRLMLPVMCRGGKQRTNEFKQVSARSCVSKWSQDDIWWPSPAIWWRRFARSRNRVRSGTMS